MPKLEAVPTNEQPPVNRAAAGEAKRLRGRLTKVLNRLQRQLRYRGYLKDQLNKADLEMHLAMQTYAATIERLIELQAEGSGIGPLEFTEVEEIERVRRGLERRGVFTERPLGEATPSAEAE